LIGSLAFQPSEILCRLTVGQQKGPRFATFSRFLCVKSVPGSEENQLPSREPLASHQGVRRLKVRDGRTPPGIVSGLLTIQEWLSYRWPQGRLAALISQGNWDYYRLPVM
jgi:hypothetical protein